MLNKVRLLASCFMVFAALVSCQAMETSPAIAPDNAVRIVRLATLEGHTAQVRDVTFSHDGRTLASSADDQTVRLWDVLTGQEVLSFRKPLNATYLNSLSFSPDGRLLASPQTVWDLQSLAIAQELAPDVNHVAFSADGALLAVGAELQPVRLLDTATWTVVRTFESQRVVEPTGDDSFGFEFSPDGTLLASGGLQVGVARVWDVASGTLAKTLRYSESRSDVHDVAFSADGRLLAAGGQAPWARLFDVGTGEVTSTLMSGEVLSLDFSADGRIVAVTQGSNTATLWDVETGRMVRSLSHSAGVFSLAFSPDGRVLACGSYEGTITLWAVPK